MKKELEEVRIQALGADRLDLSVSQVSVYWHIDHLLRAIIGICKALEDADPSAFRYRFSLSKFLVFTFQYIPRGTARAPKATIPQDSISQEALIDKLQKASKLLDSVERLPSSSFFTHYIFGQLNFKDSMKMIKIHTRHHLRIIRSIKKGQ
ncbi:MAG: DUF1569 domain-containing protein [Cyclobacteriaceae bacterium]|nr:DUF1569 domain-containing protein [Cyclobacteriaceae bacterium]